MKTCGALGPAGFYTCQFVYKFRFAVTSKTCTSKPREVDLMNFKKEKRKKKKEKVATLKKVMATV